MISMLQGHVPEAGYSAGAIVLRIGAALLLVAANAFFVAAEFALVGARRTRIEALARAGNRRAKLADAAIHRLDHYISGTQLGITLASLGLGWVGESTIAVMIRGLFGTLPPPWDVVATHAVAGTVAFAAITFLHIVLGELAPKSLALLYPEEVSLWTAGPLILFARVFTPVIGVLNGTANLLIRSLGMQPPHELERVHRPEEIEMLVTQSYQHGLLKEEPVEMIRGIFHLSETMASEVMTPRTELVALAADLPIPAAADIVLEEGYSRYPVYEETVDHIIGMVTARDIWRAERAGQEHVREVLRDVPFVPDSKPLEALLREMQEEGEHMVVVVDEFGGTAGVVTLEDLLEEIVGDIVDLEDQEEDIVETPEGELHLRGGYAIADLNDAFQLKLPEDDYTTIAGFILGRLGRVAVVGDEVRARGALLRVLAVEGRRIERVALSFRPAPEAGEPGGGQGSDAGPARS
ncbi:MAG: HlyC/CorC family transporter [Gemmatimonadetes bacterium]|nr:HlyC/CorC family transporter [Gemmatimonadota bacterium]